MAGKSGTVIALLAGAAIGAGLGILFAPEEGTKTRRKIKRGYDSRVDDLKDKVGELSEQVKSKLGFAKYDLETGFDSLVANVEDKKDEVIATLERKLAELKKATSKEFY